MMGEPAKILPVSAAPEVFNPRVLKRIPKQLRDIIILQDLLQLWEVADCPPSMAKFMSEDALE
jgi:hypothetical protein